MWFWNTFFVSAVTTLISVIISVMAGFAIARLRFRGAALAGTLVFITYLAPKGFLFVPLAQILKDWGLLGGLPALMVTYPTFLIPFCTWLLSGYFANVPHEPEECAMVDGASRIGAIVRITLPMALPGIITAAIFSFTASWNELLYSIAFVNGEQNKMLTTGVIGALHRRRLVLLGAIDGRCDGVFDSGRLSIFAVYRSLCRWHYRRCDQRLNEACRFMFESLQNRSR